MSDNQMAMALPAPAVPASELITGAFAREVAGLPTLTPEERHRQAIAQRYGGTTPAWRLWLDAAIDTDPRGAAGVAERLGVSRPYVSRIANFHMSPAPQAFIDRIHAIVMQVQCPHLGQAIAPAKCREYAARDYAAITQFEVDHWAACRSCKCKAPPLPAGMADVLAQGEGAAPCA